MATSQQSSKEILLVMKSEGYYKKGTQSQPESEQYIQIINIYPTLQNTLIYFRDKKLIKYSLNKILQNNLQNIKFQAAI